METNKSLHNINNLFESDVLVYSLVDFSEKIKDLKFLLPFMDLSCRVLSATDEDQIRRKKAPGAGFLQKMFSSNMDSF